MVAILEAHRAGLFRKKHLLNNALAGIVVGVVAIPLAMAFAIASGVRPEQGLYTAIIAGAAVSVLGGTRLQIAGPTGAFIVILASICAKHGVNGLLMATLMAGVILIALGVMKLGAVIKFIPRPVIVGFTSGIAVIIWVGQWKDFFGLPAPAGADFHEKFLALTGSFGQMSPQTTLLSLATLAVLLYSPRLIKKVPSPLVAVLAATLIQSAFQLKGVATIGSAFGELPSALPWPSLPQFQWSQLQTLAGPAFTIALLGAIESLLSAVVADGMAGTRHDPNQELIGQGIANVLCPLFGGFAATGAIARTATNVKNGATSPLSGVVHSLVVLFTVVALAPLASNIPLCSLAAILFVVAYNMSELRTFGNLLNTAPKADKFLLVLTFLLTIFSDLVVAVNVGVGLASLVFMARMAAAVQVEEDKNALKLIQELEPNGFAQPGEGDSPAQCACDRVIVYTITGPFFFAASDRIEDLMASIHAEYDTIILRFGNVPFIDATGVDTFMNIVRRMHKHNRTVVLCNVRPYVLDKFEKSGLVDMVGRENLIKSIEDYRCCAKPA